MDIPNKTLSLMVAMSENHVIGKDGDLPWHLPKDFKRFKDKTVGHHIIMGRKTFESLGSKPLPKRPNIVISTQKTIEGNEEVNLVHNLEDALAIVRNSDDPEPFVIGGGKIYELALPLADRIYLTIVHTTLKGDTFFPNINEAEWEITKEQTFQPDDKHDYPFTFYTYDRKPL